MDRLYRPITTSSYLVNYSLLGGKDDATEYHLLNVLLHIVNAWLVFALALVFLRQREQAFCAAALWAVHPITTESVTNVAGRADLLACTAVLSGILLYSKARSTVGSTRWLAAIILFCIATAGVFSKENAAVLLGLVVLWDVSFGFGGQKGIVARVPFYVALGTGLLLGCSLCVGWFSEASSGLLAHFSTTPLLARVFGRHGLRLLKRWAWSCGCWFFRFGYPPTAVMTRFHCLTRATFGLGCRWQSLLGV